MAIESQTLTLPNALRLSVWVVMLIFAGSAPAEQIPTTIEDFFQPGSQPNPDLYGDFRSSNTCRACHTDDDGVDLLIASNWEGSMMAQAVRDPLFRACLTVANQDAAFAGDICLRCHTPAGWLGGRSDPTDGSSLQTRDFEGISCTVCHRMVDPDYKPGVSPDFDGDILANINPLPISPGGGNLIIDAVADIERPRGPFADPSQSNHLSVYSPFHQTSELCATCHDVSNPVYLRQPDGTYTLTALGQNHPTADKHDMFPIERTYTEWRNSEFAATGVDMNGRFGGNKQIVRTCQDCHMPDVTGRGCAPPSALPLGPIRDDIPSHEFAGGNAWVQDMILNLYPDDGLNPDNLAAAQSRAVSMLQRAATLDAQQLGSDLRIRVFNQTGHKLPSGYPEGRRMWINMRFYDADQQLTAERGHYDDESADLTTGNTKVYEAHLGIDDAVASLTGLTSGQSFHFAINNVFLKDNRIPPRGFTNAAFRAGQAAPVADYYADGQYWDDTRVILPADAASVTVNLYYQTASKEYITFLRDENHTDDAGDVLYEQWERTGKSPPVLMATQTVELTPFANGDHNGNGSVELADYVGFANCPASPDTPIADPDCQTFDFDADDDLDLLDFAGFQLRLGM